MIFLSLRFYVKSILSKKYVILAHIMKLCTFWRLKFTNLTKFRPLKKAKTAVLEFRNYLELISRKIWVIEISWNFHTVNYNTFVLEHTFWENSIESQPLKIGLKYDNFNSWKCSRVDIWAIWKVSKCGLIKKVSFICTLLYLESYIISTSTTKVLIVGSKVLVA